MDKDNKDYENDEFQLWNNVESNGGNQKITQENDTTKIQNDSLDINNEMQKKIETQEKTDTKEKTDFEGMEKEAKADEAEVEEPKKTSTKFLEEIVSWVKVIILALVLSLILNKFVFFNFTVPTESMENTIMVDNRIMSLRCAYLFSDPKRGDIIVFPFPDNPEETYIKRVIGLPGETIEGRDGLVYINGEALAEDYVTSELEDDFGPYEIPEDSYFVLGDNRYVSLDARYWDNKFVKREDIISKAILRFYPGLKILK